MDDYQKRCVQKKRPCSTCPFSKKVEPGKLGGSPVERFVAQAHGPFWLPCHQSYGDTPESMRDKNISQCAGAALFRDKIGVGDRMPSPLLKLDSSGDAGDLVFGSAEEFFSHHTGVGIDVAAMIIRSLLPAWFAIEFSSPTVEIDLVEKQR